jgi:hypothetical protein
VAPGQASPREEVRESDDVPVIWIPQNRLVQRKHVLPYLSWIERPNAELVEDVTSTFDVLRVRIEIAVVPGVKRHHEKAIRKTRRAYVDADVHAELAQSEKLRNRVGKAIPL